LAPKCSPILQFSVYNGALGVEIMPKRFALSIIAAAALSSSAFAQTPAVQGQRIAESIVINGQTAQGALVLQNGAVQTFTCPSPEHYATADQSESGWACYEGATRTWLLHALPPPQESLNQAPPIQQSDPPQYTPPATVYAPPAPVYSYPYYNYYPYDYGYYPYGYYGYPYYGFSAGFGFGYGFGFRSPVFVNRTVVVSRPVVSGRPIVGTRSVGVSGTGVRSVGARAAGSVAHAGRR
jgi:hypothetical protein